ncbi:TetR/AcrR family transcriptional regulator [Arcobacter sp.]|uniref:TetR/AcrR family transcriptional regulator n=1 Tax=Arcobacter sp. TaxID=1872629 RepID=UPI003D127C83
MKRNRPLNEEKRKAILKAATVEFYEKGFEGSSMDTISKKANVSKATVYNHFKSKEELFLSIAYMLKDRFSQSFRFEYTKDKSIDEQLNNIAKKEIDFLTVKENIELIQIVTIVLIQKNEIGVKLLEEVNEDNITMTTNWFEQAHKDGKLNIDDSEFIARQFIGMIKAFAFYPQLYGAPLLDKKEQERVIKKSVEMVKSLYLVK